MITRNTKLHESLIVVQFWIEEKEEEMKSLSSSENWFDAFLKFEKEKRIVLLKLLLYEIFRLFSISGENFVPSFEF